jgi:hypothetical protein
VKALYGNDRQSMMAPLGGDLQVHSPVIPYGAFPPRPRKSGRPAKGKDRTSGRIAGCGTAIARPERGNTEAAGQCPALSAAATC